MRNYELEQDLLLFKNEEYVISEWCPFNGVFCSWVHHAPLEVLQEAVRVHRGQGVINGMNYEYIADYCEKYIKERGLLGETTT